MTFVLQHYYTTENETITEKRKIVIKQNKNKLFLVKVGSLYWNKGNARETFRECRLNDVRTRVYMRN